MQASKTCALKNMVPLGHHSPGLAPTSGFLHVLSLCVQPSSPKISVWLSIAQEVPGLKDTFPWKPPLPSPICCDTPLWPPSYITLSFPPSMCYYLQVKSVSL